MKQAAANPENFLDCYRRSGIPPDVLQNQRERAFYSVDAVAGVKSRRRLAAGVNEELVRNACAMSCIRIVTGNRVSRQTVTNRLRESHVSPTPEQVKVLHVLEKSQDQKNKNRSLFSRLARPRSGRLSPCPFRQGYAPFQCPAPLLTSKPTIT